MECPHCGYVHGWDRTAIQEIKGAHGDFYRLPIKMERISSNDSVSVVACPNCSKVFVSKFQ